MLKTSITRLANLNRLAFGPSWQSQRTLKFTAQHDELRKTVNKVVSLCDMSKLFKSLFENRLSRKTSTRMSINGKRLVLSLLTKFSKNLARLVCSASHEILVRFCLLTNTLTSDQKSFLNSLQWTWARLFFFDGFFRRTS